MTPPDRLRLALATIRWSQRTLAAALRRDEKQVRRWLEGAYQPPDDVLAWLDTLAAFHAAHPPP